MSSSEARIALYLDFENLAIGAREDLGGHTFSMKPIADALAERGRVVVRRAYGDWTMWDEARRMLVEHHVELIEIPQRLGASRKNAADIKMAVDALELSFERDYITTFVIVSGDSDFTPLVHKLRELDKKVIGIGLKASTSALLPPACDEFLFYENLDGVEVGDRPSRRSRSRKPRGSGSGDGETSTRSNVEDIERLVTQTLSGLQSSADGVVLASSLKRALLRKDPTFSEADYGFRGFGELMSSLAERGVVELSEGPARGDPEVTFPEDGGAEDQAFRLLAKTVEEAGHGDPVPLSGLKDRIRKEDPDFSEKAFGFRGFLQFSRAAAARDVVEMDWDDDADDYLIRPAG
ncbi:MAG: NYN domain-containing protein [Acidimicrobiia bacterium]|nr:NYN domain-containing protein [Acidimicrobiia bacterium]